MAKHFRKRRFRAADVLRPVRFYRRAVEFLHNIGYSECGFWLNGGTRYVGDATLGLASVAQACRRLEAGESLSKIDAEDIGTVRIMPVGTGAALIVRGGGGTPFRLSPSKMKKITGEKPACLSGRLERIARSNRVLAEVLRKRDITIIELDLLRDEAVFPSHVATEFGLPRRIGIPADFVRSALISAQEKAYFEDFYQLLKEKGAAEIRLHVRAAGGIVRHVDLRAYAAQWDGGRPIYAVAEAKKSPAAAFTYRRDYAFPQRLLNRLSAVYAIDFVEGKVTVCRSDGTPEEVFDHERLLDVLSRRCIDKEEIGSLRALFCREHLRRCASEGIASVSYEYRRTNEDATVQWVSVRAELSCDADGTPHGFAYIKNIDARKKRELMLGERAERDTLTGVYTEATALAMTDAFLRVGQARSRALIVVELTGLAEAAAVGGKQAGDELLRKTARMLSDYFGEEEVVGKRGETGFFVFCDNAEDKKELAGTLETLLGTLAENLGGTQPLVTVGAAVMSADANTYGTLLSAALSALRRAEREGNSFFVADEPDDWTDGFSSVDELIDKIGIPIAVLDAERLTFLAFNHRAKALFGSRASAGRHCYEFNYKSDRRCSECPAATGEIAFCRKLRLSDRYPDVRVDYQKILWRGKPAYLLVYGGEGSALSESDAFAGEVFAVAQSLQKTDADLEETFRFMNGVFRSDGAAYLEFDCRGGKLLRTEGIELGAGEQALLEQTLATADRSVDFPLKIGSSDLPAQLRSAAAVRGAESVYVKRFSVADGVCGLFALLNPRSVEEGELCMMELRPFLEQYTRRRFYQTRADYLLRHDVLTGALNVRALADFVEAADRAAYSSLGVVCTEIAGMADRNKKLGIREGDKLIRSLYGMLAGVFSENHIYRVGSTKFFVVMPDVEYEHFEGCVRSFRAMAAVRPDMFACGHVWAADTIVAERLCLQAEDQMKTEKLGFRDEEAQARSMNEAARNKLRALINRGDFRVFLQPKADCVEEKIIGAEALARFCPKSGEMLLPGNFIEVLERTRTISYLDLFVFEKVCETLAQWRRQGLPMLTVSLNFSRFTLFYGNLVPQITSIAEKYGVSARLIEIEITETAGEANPDEVAVICKRIKEAGFRLSLDDFGAGYSSMRMLTMINYDALKLDRSLVTQLGHNEIGRLITRAAIKVCEELGIDCVGEGAESEEQVRCLRDLGCRYIQGFVVNKPLEIDTFVERYLKK